MAVPFQAAKQLIIIILCSIGLCLIERDKRIEILMLVFSHAGQSGDLRDELFGKVAFAANYQEH